MIDIKTAIGLMAHKNPEQDATATGTITVGRFQPPKL
jgi:hypothetical protein